MVMLRPVLVILGGGADGDSSQFTSLARPVHLSTRFLLGARFLEVIVGVVAQSFWSLQLVSSPLSAVFFEPPLEPSFPAPFSYPPEPFHEPPFSLLPAIFSTRQHWYSSLSCSFSGVFPCLLPGVLLPLLHVTL
jgi:hypothetical protein